MAIYRVTTLQNMFGQRFMNVLHYDTNATLSGNDAIEIADVVRQDYLDSDLTDGLDSEWSYVGIELRRVDLPDQPAIEAAPTAGPLPGGVSGDALPTQVALLVSGTALTTFPRRTRTYLAGFTETACANSLWTQGVQNLALEFIMLLDTVVITAATLKRAAVRYVADETGYYVTDHNLVEAYLVSPVPATQRRRRRGVGI